MDAKATDRLPHEEWACARIGNAPTCARLLAATFVGSFSGSACRKVRPSSSFFVPHHVRYLWICLDRFPEKTAKTRHQITRERGTSKARTVPPGTGLPHDCSKPTPCRGENTQN